MTASEIANQLQMTCARFPNQFEGTVDGHRFYFRARHGAWGLYVDEDDYRDMASVEGEMQDAGYWNETDAREWLVYAIQIWLERGSTMTHDEAVKKLDALMYGDNEAVHAEADAILVRYLMHNDCEDIAKAYEAARERCQFWYA